MLVKDTLHYLNQGIPWSIMILLNNIIDIGKTKILMLSIIDIDMCGYRKFICDKKSCLYITDVSQFQIYPT